MTFWTSTPRTYTSGSSKSQDLFQGVSDGNPSGYATAMVSHEKNARTCGNRKIVRRRSSRAHPLPTARMNQKVRSFKVTGSRIRNENGRDGPGVYLCYAFASATATANERNHAVRRVTRSTRTRRPKRIAIIDEVAIPAFAFQFEGIGSAVADEKNSICRRFDDQTASRRNNGSIFIDL